MKIEKPYKDIPERRIIFSSDDHKKKIMFLRKAILPEYRIVFQFTPDKNNEDDIKLIKDASAYMFTETPCIMLRCITEKAETDIRDLLLSVSWQEYEEVDMFKFYRCGIQQWINNADGYDTSKAEAKRPT